MSGPHSGPSSVGADKRAWLLARAARSGRLSCVYCDSWVARCTLATRLDSAHIATLDHVLPRTRGGSHSVLNLVVSCMRCNSGKGDLPLWSYLPSAAPQVVSELLSLPTPESLGYWRDRILARGAAAAEERNGEPSGYWARLTRAERWAGPNCAGWRDAVECPAGLDPILAPLTLPRLLAGPEARAAC